VVLEGNTAPGSGGALGLQADTTATFGLWNGDVTFLENSATDHGGAIFAESDGSVDSPVILTAADAYELNAAGGDGGAVALFDEASIELSDGGTFTTNAAIGNGGAIAAHDNAEVVLPHGRVVATTNLATNGGAISAADESVVTLNQLQFVGNIAADHGGGLHLVGSPVVESNGCWYHENDATRGGGIAVDSDGLGGIPSLTVQGTRDGEGCVEGVGDAGFNEYCS
jgi:predicted outer membrane repeat protein